MARVCEVCGKGTSVGNRVSYRGRAKYLGGVGIKITGVSRRKFKPNLQNVRVSTDNGTHKTMRVCTQCIRSGRVQKIIRRSPFQLPSTEEVDRLLASGKKKKSKKKEKQAEKK